ncbi:MAG: YtxH domain-containing protein [Cryomorphaceae bacterium]|nr:MAG: YtxH domain-containing protein [Cryomorphaceae bacterium]
MKNSNSAVKQSKNIGLIIGSILVGAVAGSVATLFLAPQKGKDLRNEIANKADEIKDLVKSKYNKLFNNLKQDFEKEKELAKVKVQDVKENAKDFAGTM